MDIEVSSGLNQTKHDPTSIVGNLSSEHNMNSTIKKTIMGESYDEEELQRMKNQKKQKEQIFLNY